MTTASITAPLASERTVAPPRSSTGNDVRCPARISSDDFGCGIGSWLAPSLVSRCAASSVDSPRWGDVERRSVTSTAGRVCQGAGTS